MLKEGYGKYVEDFNGIAVVSGMLFIISMSRMVCMLYDHRYHQSKSRLLRVVVI